MPQPYFTVWQEPKTNGWRFTLWGANGRPLFQSLREYTTKRGAKVGCSSVVSCFCAWAGGPHKPIYDGATGKLLNS